MKYDYVLDITCKPSKRTKNALKNFPNAEHAYYYTISDFFNSFRKARKYAKLLISMKDEDYFKGNCQELVYPHFKIRKIRRVNLGN